MVEVFLQKSCLALSRYPAANPFPRPISWRRAPQSRRAARESQASLFPVDSEHNAIFQCLPDDLQRKDDSFKDFANQLASTLLEHRPDSVEDAAQLQLVGGATVEVTRQELIAKIGEKITIGKAKTIENNGTVNNHYLHTVVKDNISKLAVIVSLETKDNSETVKTFGKTGVEMEALTACSVAALTIYDMCKAMDKSVTIEEIKLLEKTGGKSGDWERPE